MLEGCDGESGGCSWGIGLGLWSMPVASMLATKPVPNCLAGTVNPAADEVVTAGALDSDPEGFTLVLTPVPCTTSSNVCERCPLRCCVVQGKKMHRKS